VALYSKTGTLSVGSKDGTLACQCGLGRRWWTEIVIGTLGMGDVPELSLFEDAIVVCLDQGGCELKAGVDTLGDLGLGSLRRLGRIL
jgi:hypothetical protein